MTRLEEQASYRAMPKPVVLGVELGDAIFGVVHDLGNLIQVASSALNIVSRNPDLDMASPVGATIASARVSLQRAGALVQQTMRFARDGNAAVEHVDVWACLVEIEALVTATWGNSRLELYAGRELPPVVCSRIGLRCSDTGLGMSEDVLRRASEPYFTTKTSGLGGLGLPMVKRFAQETGGRLLLESEPGRGTTATLHLPILAGLGMAVEFDG